MSNRLRQGSTPVEGDPLLGGIARALEHPLLSDPCWKAQWKDWDTIIPKHDRRLRSTHSKMTNLWTNSFKLRNAHIRLVEALSRDKSRVIELIYLDNAAVEPTPDELLKFIQGDHIWALSPKGEELLSFANSRFERWLRALNRSWEEALLLASKTIRAADAAQFGK